MIEEEDNEKKCLNAAIKLLARKDYSKFKLEKKLEEKNFGTETISNVLNDLIEKKYFIEKVYQEGRIKGLIRKGYSFEAIFFKMEQEKCPTTRCEISTIAEELKIDENSILEKLIEKKVRLESENFKNKKKFREKVLRFAQSHGHNLSQADRIFEKLYQKSFPDKSIDISL